MILAHELVTNPSFYGDASGWTLGAAWLYPTTGALNVTYVAATKKITRAAGSFVTNGFIAGNVIYTTSTTNPGPFTIVTVVALEIVVAEVLTNEGPVSNVIKSDQANKYQDGVTTATNVSVVVGYTYCLTYEVKNRSAGDVTASVGGVSDTARSANGLYEKWFTATATTALTFTPSNTARLAIDNVHLQRLLTWRTIPYNTTIPSISTKGGRL